MSLPPETRANFWKTRIDREEQLFRTLERHIIADRLTVKRDKVGPALGRIDADTMTGVERSLAAFLGIAK